MKAKIRINFPTGQNDLSGFLTAGNSNTIYIFGEGNKLWITAKANYFIVKIVKYCEIFQAYKINFQHLELTKYGNVIPKALVISLLLSMLI